MNQRHRNNKGSVLVEAALVLPLLTILLVGIVEFGRILMVEQVITNAAREGARVGAIKLDNTQALSSAQQVSADYLARSGVDSTLATIQPAFSQLSGTEAIQVTIDYNHDSGFFGWIPGAPETVRLRSQVVMRREA